MASISDKRTTGLGYTLFKNYRYFINLKLFYLTVNFNSTVEIGSELSQAISDSITYTKNMWVLCVAIVTY